MAPFGTLHTSIGFLHFRVTKILAAANINNLQIDIAPDFKYGVTNQTPEYIAKFPHGKIPAFETPSGFYISEGSAIAYYVAASGPRDTQLLGGTAEERALVQMWVSFSEAELFENTGAILLPMFGLGEYHAKLTEEKETQLIRAVKRLEHHLSQEGKVWLVRDDEPSLADLSVASCMFWPLKFFLDVEARKEYPKIVAWWERLLSVEAVGKAFDAPVPLCEKRPPPGCVVSYAGKG